MNGGSVHTDFYKPVEGSTNAETNLREHVEKRIGEKFGNYEGWYNWTRDNYKVFWETVLKQCDIKLSTSYSKIIEDDVPFHKIPRWFPGARLNYAENCLKNGKDDRIAFIQAISATELKSYNYATVRRDVHELSTVLRHKYGVKSGDYVCAYVANRYETSVAMLAVTALGAAWSSASVDFGPEGVLDRFAQLRPKLLFVADSAIYKRKTHSLRDNINEIVGKLPSVDKVIVIPSSAHDVDLAAYSPREKFIGFHETLGHFNSMKQSTPYFEQVPFNHPLFILFSSGTTGKPKGMVHTVGGTLLKHVEEHVIQTNISEKDTMLFYTTCGWMMWNWMLSVLYTGACIVLYDESPLDPDPHVLFKVAQNTGTTILGMGAKIFDEYAKMGLDFKSLYDLSRLRLTLSTASPLRPATFHFINESIKPQVVIGSISGGTDIIGCFMGATLNRPVVAGECQHIYLGMDACTFDENGKEVKDVRGELVCRNPFPSMPSHFVSDESGERYFKAYFSKFQNVWTHGDFCIVNSQTNGIFMCGRSDTTLNRGGVRIGTAELYNVIERFEEVKDSIVAGYDDPNDAGNELVVLFLVLKDDITLTDELVHKIKTSLRKKVSPRHVPNEIFAVSDIPYTNSGKKVELAVKQVLNGQIVENTAAIRNPEALTKFACFRVQN
ncbi:AMP-binding enzyme domain-containing protein [Ditylenchus destructor]|nr:AMP-binding enzyme domain-containing protein [Ditylenchus destructor]